MGPFEEKKYLVGGVSMAQVLHEGGWWDVKVCRRLPGNARLGGATRFEVEAVGYGVKRTVDTTLMRPRPPV